MKSKIIYYKTNKNLNYFWNIGRILKIFFLIQIFTGVLLKVNYINKFNRKFYSIDNIIRNRNFGWILRIKHLNFKSFIFIKIYLHIKKKTFLISFRIFIVYNIGKTIILLIMKTKFLGYVLPIGQISFWKCNVITSLLSKIPYIGFIKIYWIWKGFFIKQKTLGLFFIKHFLLPFKKIKIKIKHLKILHIIGSTSIILENNKIIPISFFKYFWIKDKINFKIKIKIFKIKIFFPWIFKDKENFNNKNKISSPIHILPEWYFLFKYKILRCIENKFKGVVKLKLSVLIFYKLSKIYYYYKKIKNIQKSKIMILLFSFIILTFLGKCPVEKIFIFLKQIFTKLYFKNFIFLIKFYFLIKIKF